jgi:hypothetical protein
MRVLFITAAAIAALSAPTAAYAQAQGRGQPDASEKRKKKSEWDTPQGRLDRQANAGPCPFVKVLYDAGRYVELEGGRESPTAVKWSGEIQGIEADCRYRDAQPITVNMDVVFSLGRGPQAEGQSKTYRWWVAVTERNRAVIAKEYFTLNAEFQPGQDRLVATERLGSITIPRKELTTSGAEFRGADRLRRHAEMAQFNRDGKRFRPTPARPPPPGGPTAAR